MKKLLLIITVFSFVKAEGYYPSYGPGEQWETYQTTTGGWIIIDNITLDGIQINGGEEVKMDEECENFLLQYIVKFVEQVTTDSLQYARHRGADTLEDQDIKFCLKEDHGIDTL